MENNVLFFISGFFTGVIALTIFIQFLFNYISAKMTNEERTKKLIARIMEKSSKIRISLSPIAKFPMLILPAEEFKDIFKKDA